MKILSLLCGLALLMFGVVASAHARPPEVESGG
jgi:hypothetical protein